MRILHISTRLILGGSQENTVLSCEGQARLGHDVHLAFGPIYGPEGSLLERVEKFKTPDGRAITTHIVPHLVRELSPLADWRGYQELRRLIAHVQPDIVHTHSSKAGILGRAAAWREHQVAKAAVAGLMRARQRTDSAADVTDVPKTAAWPGIVHTIHGPPFMPVEGGAVSRARIRLKNRVYEVAERFAARRCHVIVSVADAMTRQFLSRRIGRPEQYVTVRSGMDIGPYVNPAPGEARAQVRSGLGLCDGDFVVGTVARLAEHKGHDDLLDALGEDLRARRSWKLLWVGDGWWRERLVARARGLGLGVAELDRSPAGEGGAPAAPPGAQVILAGLVPPQRVPALVRAMDVLAHPSYREGLPRTVPQALLSGVCPVAYDVDGTGEACRDMETGRLVAPGDRAGLRAAIAWLAEHPEQRLGMAERGRAECTHAFAAGTMVAELEKVYALAIRTRA
jgi:glycosyltransferase involved in cell wall biosynthesis